LSESKHRISQNSDDAPVRGWITPVVGAIVTLLTLPSSLILGSRLVAQQKAKEKGWARHNAIKIDTFVAICLVAECVIYAVLVLSPGANPALRIAIVILVLWRIADILATAVRIPVFDPLRATRDRPHVVGSTERVIVLGFVNYVELALCFACVYAFWPDLISTNGTKLEWFDPLYLSCVTQLTIGFGDLSPTHGLRLASCLQGFASLGVVALLIGRFLASLPPVPDLDDLNGDKNNKPQVDEEDQ